MRHMAEDRCFHRLVAKKKKKGKRVLGLPSCTHLILLNVRSSCFFAADQILAVFPNLLAAAKLSSTMSRHANVPLFIESLFGRLSAQIARQLVRALSVQPATDNTDSREALVRLFSHVLDEEPEPTSWPMWLKPSTSSDIQGSYELVPSLTVSVPAAHGQFLFKKAAGRQEKKN